MTEKLITPEKIHLRGMLARTSINVVLAELCAAAADQSIMLSTMSPNVKMAAQWARIAAGLADLANSDDVQAVSQ